MKIICIFLLMVIVGLSCKQAGKSDLELFSLTEVQLHEGIFHNAQQVNLRYILELDTDRLLAPFIIEAGLVPVAERYGNWENTGLDGHIGGHYLSALSLMYASTGEPELLGRIEYMVEWLDKCQQANGNGYVGGIPGGKEMWEEIANGNIMAENFSLNGKWVPWYNIHKLYSGLRDVYLLTGNEKALDILVRLCDWSVELVKDLTDDQVQEMLVSEHGGMNEVFTDVANITGNPLYMELAERFSHRAILDPLLNRENRLTGLHSNTQIPKVIGYKKYADATGNAEWDQAAIFFWNTVIGNWTVSIGGNSVREHFHPADDYSSMISSNEGPETCNTYNMLRLTTLLHMTGPATRYLDYYERALYNHILSSIHPEKGGFVYMTPMRPRHYRVYSQPHESFWCCVGSGLENHGKYGEMIYMHDKNDIYINLFIPSALTWTEKGISLVQDTGFPFGDHTAINLRLDKPSRFNINIRIPGWADQERFSIEVNGEEQPVDDFSETYIAINRRWKTGDQINVSLPMKTTIEYLPDGSQWASVVHGPVVLAAVTDSTDLEGLFADDSRMGHIAAGPYYPLEQAPSLVTSEKDFSAWIKPVEGEPLNFKFEDILNYSEKDLTLIPFFLVHDSRYVIYWPVNSTAGSATD
jgi:uncharacterized protein